MAALGGPWRVSRNGRTVTGTVAVIRDDACRIRTDHAPANFTTAQKKLAYNPIRTAAGRAPPAPRANGRRVGRRLPGQPHRRSIAPPMPQNAAATLASQRGILA
jgi:hypothetical protein